jgi:hypothetical protein
MGLHYVVRFDICTKLRMDAQGYMLKKFPFVKFHVLTEANMKITTFWDVLYYTPVVVDPRFRVA